jgi:tRNA (cytidine32/uridine32-2'-O)-methyltransferase
MDVSQNISTLALANVRIVLMQTKHPGNIGAAARAMKTMGLSQLYLVAPEEFPSSKATAMSSNADDVLANAVVVNNLEQALMGCGLVIGTSARQRKLPWPLIEPRACAELVMQHAATQTVALVFGREDKGLLNDELARCHYHVCIPANPDYSSLNLAAAVQILSYELRLASQAMPLQAKLDSNEFALASAEYVSQFYQHLQLTLQKLAFLDDSNTHRVMNRLRRLFNRSRLERKELNILRGILASVEKHLSS